MKTIGPMKTTATAGLITAQYQVLSPWFAASDFKSVKALLSLTRKAGNFTVAPAYQTAATDRSSPDAWATIEASATYLSSNGDKDCTPVTDLSSALDEKFYVRFGIAVKNSSTSNLSRGDVELSIQGRAG